MTLRRLLGGLAGLLAVASLSACTPVSDGVVGLQREQDGSLSVVVRMCQGSVNRVHLRDFDSDAYTTWTFDDEVGPTGTFPLDDGFSSRLHEGHTYDIGVSTFHGASADGPSMTPESVAALTPGQILLDPFVADHDATDPPLALVVTSDDFSEDADRYCDTL